MKIFFSICLLVGSFALIACSITPSESEKGSGISDLEHKPNNKGTNTIITIPQMNNPITITLSGQTNIIYTNCPMNTIASVPANTGNVIFTWYINGEQQNTGTNCIVNIGTPGFCRLDVTVFTTDGQRAGIVTFNFNVIDCSLNM